MERYDRPQRSVTVIRSRSGGSKSVSSTASCGFSMPSFSSNTCHLRVIPRCSSWGGPGIAGAPTHACQIRNTGCIAGARTRARQSQPSPKLVRVETGCNHIDSPAHSVRMVMVGYTRDLMVPARSITSVSALVREGISSLQRILHRCFRWFVRIVSCARADPSPQRIGRFREKTREDPPCLPRDKAFPRRIGIGTRSSRGCREGSRPLRPLSGPCIIGRVSPVPQDLTDRSKRGSTFYQNFSCAGKGTDPSAQQAGCAPCGSHHGWSHCVGTAPSIEIAW